MLHLENFFEKSFALLLTTPIVVIFIMKELYHDENCAILTKEHVL